MFEVEGFISTMTTLQIIIDWKISPVHNFTTYLHDVQNLNKISKGLPPYPNAYFSEPFSKSLAALEPMLV